MRSCSRALAKTSIEVGMRVPGRCGTVSDRRPDDGADPACAASVVERVSMRRGARRGSRSSAGRRPGGGDRRRSPGARRGSARSSTVSQVSLPAVQAAAVAATGFVAGAATFALVRRHGRAQGRARPAPGVRRRRPVDLLPIVGSRTFLVDVHLSPSPASEDRRRPARGLRRRSDEPRRRPRGRRAETPTPRRGHRSRSASRSGRRGRFALPRRAGLDGLTRIDGGVLHRLVHAGEEPVARPRRAAGTRPRPVRRPGP